MVSKNNIQLKDRYATKQVPHYGIRKLSVGVASVLLSTTLYMGVTAHADTIAETNPQPTIDQPVNTKSGTSTGDATIDVQSKPTADQSASEATNSPASGTNTSSKPVQTVSPEQPADTTAVQPASDQLESAAANSSTSENGANTQSASAVLPKQPANVADTQPAAEVGAQPFMNLAVVSDNNELAPKRETVDSTWTVHYVNQADHKQELKGPTVITMQYTRTNTPQSDGTTQYGDWSYVPGSFKQTGTPITIKDSDNPVKQDNIDKNGENMDTFTITAMYPTVAGYEFHDGVNGTRLRDNLRNNERQADTMSKDFYAEYDVAKERSVAVKFVDDQSFDFDTIDHKEQVGQAVTLTGRDGDTVDLKLTVPDKYKLADGQQLPTTYTFAKGSGDLTIHLVHQVVQREATVNVKLVMMTRVDIEGIDLTRMNTTQEQWGRLGDKVNITGPGGIYEILPSVEVGTLTGHVNYDVVDNSVVSLGDDWTALNLGGRTYQLPNGTDVVNGVLTDSDDGSLGKPLREYYLTHYSIFNPGHSVDPDYATRPWYGYLSVNETNDPNNPASEWNDLGLQGGLAGNEPNALAKANGDRAATAVEMTNKTIEASVLNPDIFREQDGQLQATLPVPVVGVYIPYVEKAATRTINVTTPDGKTSTVKQTATLEKQIDFDRDAHPDWTTGEWTSYDVPTIPGYTASQSNVAKETVTGTTKDQTVNITYTANPQTTTVVYQTEDGTPVHTTTVNGHTGQTVKVSNEVPVGWKIINGKVPSEITFGPNGTPQTVVTIAHQHVTVDPDHPQNNGTKLPDNSGKTFSGVEANDLNKTITRTIKVTTPDGQTKTFTQTAKLTRTADVDEVTGEVTYGQWTTDQWGAYDVPTVPGYTASQTSVAATPVDGNTKNQTIDISYTANSQTIHINYVDDDNAGKIVHATTVTGKTGETVSLNLTVPDKYRLADVQQLPTTYTFAKGSGDLTIHLVHQVVQREAAVDVQLGLVTMVDNGVVDDGALTIAVTQNHWKQLDDDIKDSKNPNSDKVFPSVKVGTLTGHVNYDLVDNKVVSFADDWTKLNLGGQTYQMPDGTEVVNGVATGSVYSWGKSLKEQLLKYHPDTDPDYVNRSWHGYLSVNETNENAPDFTRDDLQAGLVGDESNALAKASGDQAATAVKIANKTIDSNWLKGNFDTSEFSEQNGRLQGSAKFDVLGVYIPYVEKKATRTIKVTTPDDKTTTFEQTATLSKQINFGQDAHADWTTGEWASYDVPTVPGYTVSQSQVAKETVMGTTNDQTVNITYTANPQTTTVVYQTEDSTPVHTTMVNGHTGQTVKVPTEVPVGWRIVNGKVPSEITFEPNGTPKTVVTIAHSHVTVAPDASKTTSDKLPDNQGKTYPAGVGHDDLNKTVTGTIKVTMPDGQIKTVVKAAHLTRTADVDEVTGEVTYSDWTTGYWSDYTAPSVPGYTANYPYIAGQSVDGETEDQTIEITYTGNEHQISVEYVDDDDHGKIVKTDQVSGKTDQTITVTPSTPDNYDLVNNGNRTYTVTSDDAQAVQIHVKHHQVATSENKMVIRTINIHTPHDGVKTIKQIAELTRKVTTDQVTGEKTYDDWTTGQWEAYTPKAIPGYTPSINEVPNTNVGGSSNDQTVDVTYTANAQTVEIVYVDDAKGGVVVKTDQVTGKTDETVKVTPDVPVGYKVVGKVPGSYTMTANGHQTITVHLVHQTKTTSENKTVTRTINVHTPHDGVKTIKQTAMLTRTVTTDQVTGEKIYGDWLATLWDHYAVPEVAGYVPSIKQVAQQVVNGTTTDQTVDVTYSSGEHTTHINYVDGDGNTVHTTTIKGQTDGTAQVPNEVPAGWTVTDGQVPDEITFGPDGHADVTVTVGHQHVTVTSDQPKTSAYKLPDNPAKTYPSGVGHDDLNKTITRTIKITTSGGQTKTVEQTAKLTRTADVDEVTGDVTYGDWTTGEWSSCEVPSVPGYTPSQSEVPATKVTNDTKDQTVTIGYTANEQTTTIDYIDQNGKTVHTTVVNGHTDQTVKVPNESPAGWIITNGQVPTKITFGPDGHADVTVTIDHQHVTVTPDKPQTDGTKLPDNPNQTFHGVAETDLNKTLTRTIKVTTPDGKTDTIKQAAKLTRTADVDEVTGDVTYGKWTTGTWSSYTVPTVAGYTPSQEVVAEVAVNADMTDQMVTVTYMADSHTTHINYVDENGNVVHTTTVTGQTDQTVKVPNETLAGWTITTGQVPSEVTFGADGHTDVTVSIDHQTVTVTPDHPQADGIKLPDNPTLTFHGVDEGDLNKTVTRTIKLNVPVRDPQVITQTVRLTRTATVDEVTGEVTYGNWTSGQWDVYEVPAVDGYTASQTTIPAVNVTSETTSQDIVIDYVAVPKAQTTPSNNQTDENQVTPEKVVTVANGTVQETKQDAIKNSGQSTVQDTNQLPQTGNDNRAGLLSLIGSSLMASLAIFGLSKKKKHEN